MTPPSDPPERHCLVTVGATVGFRALTQQVLDPAFWAFLRSRAFTTLHVQCGPDVSWASARLSELLREDEGRDDFSVDVFDVKANLMSDEMMRCKGQDRFRIQGLVISHAGTGTILDAWKLGVPLVVVPNTELLDDHQTQMARLLATEGYATMAEASRESLQEAVLKAELLAENKEASWRANATDPRQGEALRLWDIRPDEVTREQKAQMSHD
ncbi:UDP-N-acetylglucosamine transferase subunit alg13 [Hirsutella rhossiliensis]|uniref:UDP-N-acetylglucosamine transferase subunit ALG13 n=1 Tax=Hirsutella rhossiliensis TaxID=111463 RepID=A0A9P8MMY5_9HYPO|nr:UDP-N-acetylglucosamine transferase subunit alg13 [Hirsutella rhossiliensis]KAH0958343.1 UDP-N-acetylglucosamine transferase subunit alg13 [Hirsutella rhossiliensis]